MTRSALAAIFGAGLAAMIGYVCISGWESVERGRLQTLIVRHRSEVERESGLIAHRIEISRQFRASGRLSGVAAREKIIEVVGTNRKLRIHHVELSNQGRRASLEISGSYANLLETVVVLPARVDGLTLQHVSLAAMGDERDEALARIEGTFP